MESAPTVKVDI